MKILKLTIKNPSQEVIREVEFEEKGLSVIYGNVSKPNDDKETSNSIGKTLFLKFIDYILGANESSEIVKSDIHGWILEAVVKYNNSTKNVRRILGNSELEIEGEKYSINEYKDKFQIERSLLSKQIFLNQKVNLIGNRSDASKDDFIALLKLLNLADVSDETNEYYLIQDNIKDIKKFEKKFMTLFKGREIEEIEERIFLLNKEIDEKENKLQEIEKNISNINVSEDKQALMDEYADKNYALKLLQADYQKLRIEKKRLKKSADELTHMDITSNEIKKLYDKAKFELPELILRRLAEVEKFHESVFLDRKNLIESKLSEIEMKMNGLGEKVASLEVELHKIAAIISENEIYKESIALYKDITDDLQHLKFEQGELSKFESLIKERKDQEDKLAIKYTELKQTYSDSQNKIEKYREFIYNMIPDIYTEDVDAYFSVTLKNMHKRNRPLAIDLRLTGDTGEGVGEVRKILIDLLIFKYNSIIEMLIQDSSCFSGIDNRQVTNLIKLGHNIGIQEDKQYILSLNDYQLNKNDSIALKLVKERTKLKLDENEKLLGFNF